MERNQEGSRDIKLTIILQDYFAPKEKKKSNFLFQVRKSKQDLHLSNVDLYISPKSERSLRIAKSL